MKEAAETEPEKQMVKATSMATEMEKDTLAAVVIQKE